MRGKFGIRTYAGSRGGVRLFAATIPYAEMVLIAGCLLILHTDAIVVNLCTS